MTTGAKVGIGVGIAVATFAVAFGVTWAIFAKRAAKGKERYLTRPTATAISSPQTPTTVSLSEVMYPGYYERQEAAKQLEIAMATVPQIE